MATVSWKNNLEADEEDGDTYTSDWYQAGTQDRIVGTVFADQVCEVSVEQSGDGENIDYATDGTTTANEGFKLDELAILPYYRLVVHNTGTEATTEFRAYIRTTSAGPR